jgi:hypothetical protein
VPRSQPKYDINEFLEACSERDHQPSTVTLVRGVLEKATRDFNIKTRKSLLEFIANEGLEDLEFVNSIEYRISDEIPPPICDAYKFMSGYIQGYISFFFSEFNQKWMIKSFHRSDDNGPSAMAMALKKAYETGLLPESLKRR